MALFQENRQDGIDRVENPLDIDIEDTCLQLDFSSCYGPGMQFLTVIFCLGHIQRVLPAIGPPCVVDKDIDSSKLSQSLFYRSLPVHGFGHICFNEDGCITGRCDVCNHPVTG